MIINHLQAANYKKYYSCKENCSNKRGPPKNSKLEWPRSQATRGKKINTKTNTFSS
jgi:hypothetical protein